MNAEGSCTKAGGGLVDITDTDGEGVLGSCDTICHRDQA